MRYSRFRSQMEGPNTPQRAIGKNGKKKGKVQTKSNVQRSPSRAYPGFMSEVESSDYALKPSALFSYETGRQKLSSGQAHPDISEHFQYSPMLGSLGMQYPYVPSYIHHGTPMSMGMGMIPAAVSGSSNIQPFGTHSYSQPPCPQDANGHNTYMPISTSNDVPVTAWEPRIAFGNEVSSSEPSTIKIEEDLESTECQKDVLDKKIKDEICAEEQKICLVG